MTSFRLIFDAIGGKVKRFSQIWGICARFEKNMTDSLQLTFSLTLVIVPCARLTIQRKATHHTKKIGKRCLYFRTGCCPDGTGGRTDKSDGRARFFNIVQCA